MIVKTWPFLLVALLLAPASGARAAQTLRVEAGGSIAAALEAAQPGAVIEVAPGVYHEALSVDAPRITLRGLVRGAERPVLDGRGVLNDGVIASGDGFTMTGFAVRHYKGNGVTTQGVNGVILSDLQIDDTGLYGVYPVQSRNITVTHCTVTRIRDAAIYVGESNHALVAFNEVHGNVAGIEIENTNDAEVRDNLAWNNTAGILVFVLPNKLQKEGRRTRVFRNWALRNNTPNFGDPAAIVGSLPHGIGIMVMGADQTIVEDNWVKGNDSVGLLVVRLAEEHAQKDPELDPFSDGTRIGFNYTDRNGGAPHPFLAEQLGGGDLAWDGTGRRNCGDLPDSATRGGVALPACGAEAGSSPPAPEAAPAASSTAPSRAARKAPDGAALVRIQGMRYEPHHLTVRKGRTVAWVNEDAVTHTVTSGDGTAPTRIPLDSPILRRGDVWTHTFEEPGRFEYLCLPHLNQARMREATVTVVE